MENRKRIIALGPEGKRFRDSNCFTTALIYGELADHAQDLIPLNPKLLNTLNLAYQNIISFQEDESFNFWHLLPAKGKDKFLKVGPNQYPLKNKFSRVRSNIADDADDTALAYSAILSQGHLAYLYGKQALIPDWVPDHPEKTFDPYRDNKDRSYRYPTNILYGNFHHTGAYLTWLEPESISFLQSPFKGWAADMRIPEGVNNIDCVVNANVLATLQKFGASNSPGFEESCKYIDAVVEKNLEGKCGIYYPNPYTLHYTVGKALREGVTCLKKAGDILLTRLMKDQLPDGSWPGGKFEEPVQSSLYATHALINLSRANGVKITPELELALHYLYLNRIEHEDGSISWPEGTIFTGGGFVRNLLSWKSEAFATALGTSIFLESISPEAKIP